MRKVRDSNPRYDVMRTPHFECGSFDHSDNFPFAFGYAFASDADKRHKSDACLRSPKNNLGRFFFGVTVLAD